MQSALQIVFVIKFLTCVNTKLLNYINHNEI